IEAVDKAARFDPTVVLMDIRMPELDGLEATRRILAANSGARILILTTFDLDEYVYEALRAGASGFVLKDDSPEQLIAAIRTVAAGDALLSPTITRRVIQRFVGMPRPTPPRELDDLSARERDVFQLVARGLSNAQIGKELFIGETTVKTHVTHILSKLGLHDRVQAVVLAYQTGVFDADELEQRLALCVEQLPAEPLVVERAALDRAVVAVVEARLEAVRPEPVGAAHPLGGVLAHPVLFDELLQSRERGLRAADARLRVLPLLDAVVLEPEPADEERQRQAHRDEREEDDGERQEEDEVASGERLARVGGERERERRRERNGAAHPGPGEEDAAAPARHAAREPLRRLQDHEDPREAHGDDREADKRRVPDQRSRRDAFERVHDDGELEPDQDEEERVQEVLHDLPHGDGLQPHLRRGQLGREPPEVDARRDGGKDGRDAEQLGGDEREVAREERDGDLRRRVVDATAELPHEPSHGQADPDPADDADDEEPTRLPRRERSGDDGHD